MKQAAIIMTLLLVSGAVSAQEEPAEPTLILSVEPSELNLKVGEKATLVATVLDDDGNDCRAPRRFLFATPALRGHQPRRKRRSVTGPASMCSSRCFQKIPKISIGAPTHS